MSKFLAHKAPSVVFTLFATSVVAFLLPRLAPGNPAVVLAGPDATPDVIAAIRSQLGLNEPLWRQYGHWMAGLFQGNLGQSYILHRPVADLIGSRMTSTLQLAGAATVVMLVVGFVLGVLGGSRRAPLARWVIDGFNTIFLAVPPFLTGLLLILLLGIVWPVLPVSGEVSLFAHPTTGLRYLLLPAIALALPQAAVIARMLQTSMLTTRSEDFVDLAKAKGVPDRRITIRHVLRNSLGSTVVIVGLRVSALLGGTVVVEAIFARNGLGALAVSSVESRDYLVIQVLILMAVFIAVVFQLLSEVVLAGLDPRIRLEG